MKTQSPGHGSLLDHLPSYAWRHLRTSVPGGRSLCCQSPPPHTPGRPVCSNGNIWPPWTGCSPAEPRRRTKDHLWFFTTRTQETFACKRKGIPFPTWFLIWLAKSEWNWNRPEYCIKQAKWAHFAQLKEVLECSPSGAELRLPKHRIQNVQNTRSWFLLLIATQPVEKAYQEKLTCGPP